MVFITYAWQALTSNTLLLVNVTPKESLNYKVLEASKKRGCRKKILSSCDSPKDIELFVCISLRFNQPWHFLRMFSNTFFSSSVSDVGCAVIT